MHSIGTIEAENINDSSTELSGDPITHNLRQVNERYSLTVNAMYHTWKWPTKVLLHETQLQILQLWNHKQWSKDNMTGQSTCPHNLQP